MKYAFYLKNEERRPLLEQNVVITTRCKRLLLLLVSGFLVTAHHHYLFFIRHLSIDDCSAKHIHLAQANNVNTLGRVSITVSFAVDRRCDATTTTTRRSISYGRASSTEAMIAVTEAPLQFHYTSAAAAAFKSDWLYHVTLPDLQAGTEEYWYQIDTMKIPFRTPPLPGQPTRLAVVGDWGQTEHSLQTMQQILQKHDDNHPISHLIVAGDMSYADSDPTRWPSWFKLMEPLLQTTLTHVAAGNHEIECDTETRDIFVPYEYYFRNPNRIRDAVMIPITKEYQDSLWHKSCSTPSEFLGYYVYGNSFYSYQYGLVHVIVLNSYTYSTVGSEQYKWLEEELRVNLDRTITPWLMVVFHAPFYTSFEGHVDEVQSRNMKHSMESLFVQYGVNWVISGHDHAYLRTHPLKYGHMTPNAPVYLTVGAGGNREGHPAAYLPLQPWVARRTMVDWGFGQFWIPNATHAHFSWNPDSFEDVRDDVWFVNPHIDVSVHKDASFSSSLA